METTQLTIPLTAKDAPGLGSVFKNLVMFT